MDETVREESPNLPSSGRIELEDFEKICNSFIDFEAESEKEADLDNCETDDEEGGRPLCDHAAMSYDVEVVQHSIAH